MPRDVCEISGFHELSPTPGCGTAYKGRLCSVTDASGTTAYEYDLLGRVTEAEETRGGLTFETAYTYDLAGNILTVTLPSGRVVTYTRDGNGQVSQVAAVVNGTGTTLASSITYLPFGPLNALTYGNSLTFSATYDTDYYLTNRTVSGSIYNHTYDTDANGNITQVGSTTFDYDELNRLDEENPGSATTYTYDATSNRLTKVQGGTTTTTVPSGSNKISAVGSDSYTYDAAGNITDDDTNEYTWNAEGELEEVEVSSTPVGTYTYNIYRQRTKKVAASTTHYVYGAGGLLYGEYDSSGDLIREYVYLNGEPLAQIDAGSPEVLTYLHTDHLGTPKFGTNTGGTQVWSWAPDAFGIGSPSGSVTVNLRMPGQYFDSESGVFYNWNRYYNPAIGRYISSDPIGLAGGLNTFGYVDQNPVNFVDPTGEFFWLAPALLVAGYTLYSHPANAPRPGDLLYARDDWGPVTSAVIWGSLGAGLEGALAKKAAQEGCSVGATNFKTGHYASRLEAAGLTTAEVEAAVARELARIRPLMPPGAGVVGRMRINNVLVEYRIRLMPDGTASVGTIFPVR